MSSHNWTLPVSSFGYQEVKGLLYAVAPVKQKPVFRGVFSDWAWTFDAMRPTERFRQTLTWATVMTEELERSGLSSADEVLTKNLQKLLTTALRCQERLTPNHLLMDELTLELMKACQAAPTLIYSHYLLPIAEDSIYDDQPLSRAVERFDELIALLAPTVPEEALAPALSLLAELDLRATLAETAITEASSVGTKG
jgi:hypothetical protein